MKRLLGPALLAAFLLVAGCGDATSDAASDPGDQTATPSPSSTQTPPDTPTSAPAGGTVDHQEIALVSQTAAGGQVDPVAVRLDDQDARETFLMQFERPGFGTRIDREIAAATVPEGYVLLGAVVSIGCDVPPGVNVTATEDGWLITPDEVAEPLQECLAPVTTVALVAVPG